MWSDQENKESRGEKESCNHPLHPTIAATWDIIFVCVLVFFRDVPLKTLKKSYQFLLFLC